MHLGAAYGRRGVQTTLGELQSDLNVRGAAEDNVNGSEATLGSASRFNQDSAWILEAAFRHAAFSVQGEYLQRQLKGTQGESDRKAVGYNLQLAYTLTGEAREYEWDEAAFAAVKPARKGLGAWEIFYRYDTATVENPEQDAEVELHTVGVNWYANEAVKVALNYVNADSDRVVSAGNSAEGRTARGDAISARLQLVF